MTKMENKVGATIVFCGDFVALHPECVKFSPRLEGLITHADLRIINFEAPVECGASPVEKSGPVLCQSAFSPKFLEQKGFNAISLANNHMFDYGIDGFQNTVAAFLRARVMGAGTWDEAYTLQQFEINGVKIGVLALCQREFRVLDDVSDPHQKIGCAWVNHQRVLRTIAESRKECDYIFVYPHCGTEDMDMPLPEWRNKYREFIDAGADAVVASHPHIIQGWEVYRDKYIFYSLGNFFFERESRYEHWKKGLVVSFSVGGGAHPKPSVVCVKRDGMQLDIDDSLLPDTEKLNKILQNKDLYYNRLNDKIRELMPMYFNYYERSLNGFSRGLGFRTVVRRFLNMWHGRREYYLLLNMIRCESHRWVFIRGIEMMLYNNSCR